MLFNKAIRQQRTAVAVKLAQTQAVLQPPKSKTEMTPRSGAQPVHYVVFQPNRFAAVVARQKPARVLGASFTAGATLGCLAGRSKRGATANTLGKVTNGIRTVVAVIALTKTLQELAKESTGVSRNQS